LLFGSLIGGSIFGFAAMGDSSMMGGFEWSSGHHGMTHGDNHHMDGYEHHEECEEYMDDHCEYENYEECEAYSDECEEHEEEYCEHHGEEQQNIVTNLDIILDQDIQDRAVEYAIDQ
jgi:hypothetical protein